MTRSRKILAAALPLLLVAFVVACDLISGQITIVQGFKDDTGTADKEVYFLSVDLSENSDYEEHKDKINADDRSRVEAAIKDLREAIGSEDKAQMESKMEFLEKEFHKVAEQMYRHVAGPQAGPGAPPPGGAGPEGPSGGSAGPDGEVIDADFEEAN